MTGHIATIDRNRCYAHARASDRRRFFMHLSDLVDFSGSESPTWSVLTIGTKVHFEPVETPKGLRATRVWMEGAPTTIAGKLGGPVISLSDRGYGFFRTTGGAKVFFSAKETGCFDTLAVGDLVVADHMEPSGDRQARAIGVRPATASDLESEEDVWDRRAS